MRLQAPTLICGGGEDRRNAVAAAGGPPAKPNGIDYLEVVPHPAAPPTLTVYFLFDLSGPSLTAANFGVAGGERIAVAVRTVAAHAGSANALDLTVDQQGDFSTYTLALQQAGTADQPPAGFDRQLRAVEFHFHLDCPGRFDCKAAHVCPPTPPPPVSINYLARDYATFRQLMIDRMSLLAPSWNERRTADAGVALIELIAYAADRLSYRQDAAATEAYLGTARLRTSVKRHARLVDYDMHDGVNARAWLHFEVNADTGTPAAPAIHPGDRFVTKLPGQSLRLADASPTYKSIAATGAQVFEALGPTITLFSGHNRMALYNWSSTECCLPKGATQATLRGGYPELIPGLVLMLAEARGPETGNEEDADPTRRWPVRLTKAATGVDPLDGTPITDVWWGAEDALPFPLCIAHTRGADETRVTVFNVSVALGNMALVDHGRTLGGVVETMPQTLATVVAGRRFRPALPEADLIFAGPNPCAADGTLAGACAAAAAVDPTTALPLGLSLSSTLTLPNPLGGPPETQTLVWTPVRSLFDPALQDAPNAFVIEAETDGTAYLRFGDGVDGAAPAAGAVFLANGYRVGRMDLGNVGAESITHTFLSNPAIVSVTNPLPASGGLARESVASARARAPYAFRTNQRAVTLDDYVRFTLKCPTVGVLRAAATSRVTRSWRTVLVTVELSGGARLDAAGRQHLIDWLDIYRMAGVDVDFANARLIPLELALHVCVDPGYRQADVAQALINIFSDRIQPDGSRGVFYPDNFTLGDPVYLSPFYAAAQSVAGVVSVRVDVFQRADRPGPYGLVAGYLKPGRTEAFTLRNNPDFPEQGLFTLKLDGGR